MIVVAAQWDHLEIALGRTFLGVLLVIPTVMGMRLFAGLGKQMFFTLAVGMVAVILGSAASYILDLPTGAAIVCAFGLLMGIRVKVENGSGGLSFCAGRSFSTAC